MDNCFIIVSENKKSDKRVTYQKTMEERPDRESEQQTEWIVGCLKPDIGSGLKWLGSIDFGLLAWKEVFSGLLFFFFNTISGFQVWLSVKT